MKSVSDLKLLVKEQIEKEPRMTLEYIEIVNVESLLPINDFKQSQSAVVCIAVKLGEVRLIDNIILY